MSETVSLKEYVDALREADNQRFNDLRAADLAAVKTAFDAANEAVEKHNDLIRKGERDAALYVTRGQVYAALGTVLIVIGLGIAWLGVA